MAEVHSSFKDLNYEVLSHVDEQWPTINRNDLAYMGTAYRNEQGMGAQLSLQPITAMVSPETIKISANYSSMTKLGQVAFPVTRLYDQGQTVMPSKLLHNRIGDPYIVMNAYDAERLRINDGSQVQITLFHKGDDGLKGDTPKQTVIVQVRHDPALPQRVVLVPRSFGIAIDGPTFIEIRQSDRVIS